jgi:hypothetical protein
VTDSFSSVQFFREPDLPRMRRHGRCAKAEGKSSGFHLSASTTASANAHGVALEAPDEVREELPEALLRAPQCDRRGECRLGEQQPHGREAAEDPRQVHFGDVHRALSLRCSPTVISRN